MPEDAPARRPFVVLRGLGRGESVTGWALVSPAVVLIGVFGLLPVLMSLQLSFQKSDLLTPETPWVGLENYRKLADDPVFVEAIKHTIIYTALFVEPLGALHLGVPNRGVHHHGGLDHLAGHHLPVADRP